MVLMTLTLHAILHETHSQLECMTPHLLLFLINMATTMASTDTYQKIMVDPDRFGSKGTAKDDAG